MRRLLILCVLSFLGACGNDGPSQESIERQTSELRQATRGAPERYSDLVESLRVAVDSAREAQLGRSGLGRQMPPPLKTACENIQKAHNDASALSLPHPVGYDQAVDRAGRSGSSCLSELANISAARPSTQVIPAIEAQLRQALSAAEAYRPSGG